MRMLEVGLLLDQNPSPTWTTLYAMLAYGYNGNIHVLLPVSWVIIVEKIFFF